MKSTTRAIGFFSFALGLVLMTPPPASAQITCNGNVSISYPQPTSPNTTRVRLTLGAGDVIGGTKLRVTKVGFYLDCRNKGCSNNFQQNCNTDLECGTGKTCMSFGTMCVDDGSVMAYGGNIASTCGVTWSTSTASGGNQIVFTASPVVQIPASSTGCTLEFDVLKVGTTSNDTTPGRVEQVAGYATAQCDNGATSSSLQSGSLNIGSNQILAPVTAPAMSGAGLFLTAGGLAWYTRRRLRRRQRA